MTRSRTSRKQIHPHTIVGQQGVNIIDAVLAMDRPLQGGRQREGEQAAKPVPSVPRLWGDASLHADIVADPSRQRTLREEDIADLCAEKDDNTVVREAADLFLPELRAIVEKGSCDVLVCAVPFPMLKRMFQPLRTTPRAPKPSSTFMTC